MADLHDVNTGSPATIALVAPMWLQDALQVLLDGTSDVSLFASATDVDSLTLLEMERAPDLVLLDADRETSAAISEVEQVLRFWPRTDLIVLVENTAQIAQLKEAGASLTLLKGASPKRLKEVLQIFADHKLRSEFATRAPASRL